MFFSLRRGSRIEERNPSQCSYIPLFSKLFSGWSRSLDVHLWLLLYLLQIHTILRLLSLFFPGRFDMNHVLFQCLQCQKLLPTSNPVIVTQLGFWPGSVSNMTYVFDPEVFLHWDLFQKESPGSSERSFLKSLEQFSSRKGRVCIPWNDALLNLVL